MNEQQIQELKNLVDKLQAEGLSQDQIQAQVDAKKQEFLNVDFQTPTTPGAVVEETAAPDTESKSEDISSGSQVANNSALGGLSIRKRFILRNPIPHRESGPDGEYVGYSVGRVDPATRMRFWLSVPAEASNRGPG